jgi:hypothetical protein
VVWQGQGQGDKAALCFSDYSDDVDRDLSDLDPMHDGDAEPDEVSGRFICDPQVTYWTGLVLLRRSLTVALGLENPISTR